MIKINLYLLFWIPLCINYFKFSFGEDEVPLVSVKQGLIRGIQEESLNGKNFYSYMSIPFAEPPVGNLRFKDPIPSKSWDGILDGTNMPTECLQIDMMSAVIQMKFSVNIIGREDCLHLNVFTSSPNDAERKLPVMVFIHGGGFLFGSANQYSPHVLMNKDIVLVVIQYRLAIFGFLSTEDSVIPGNMGLKDQQLALKWIKENIKDFGGDPNRITIFGESAGGASVNYQILSPGSKGLFTGAIMQSGASICPWASRKGHRKFSVEKGGEFNCSITAGSEMFLECMQNVNPYYLAIAGSVTDSMGFDKVYMLPRVDGKFIDEEPEILMKKGKYNKVNIISGITRDEGAFFLFLQNNNNFEEIDPAFLSFTQEENPSELSQQVNKYYLQSEDTITAEEPRLKAAELMSDRYFKVGHDFVSKIFAADKDVKFYSYQLDHFGQNSFLNLPSFNRSNLVGHGEDLPYLFHGGVFGSKNMDDKEDYKLREIILDLWVNFAKTGNPTPSGSDFTWLETTKDSFQHLSLTPSPVMKDDDFQKKRKFWSSLNTAQNLNLRKDVRDEL